MLLFKSSWLNYINASKDICFRLCRAWRKDPLDLDKSNKREIYYRIKRINTRFIPTILIRILSFNNKWASQFSSLEKYFNTHKSFVSHLDASLEAIDQELEHLYK